MRFETIKFAKCADAAESEGWKSTGLKISSSALVGELNQSEETLMEVSRMGGEISDGAERVVLADEASPIIEPDLDPVPLRDVFNLLKPDPDLLLLGEEILDDEAALDSRLKCRGTEEAIESLVKFSLDNTLPRSACSSRLPTSPSPPS